MTAFLVRIPLTYQQAKKLQPLIWSLVARMARSNDLRTQHLRQLWIKQVQLLDIEGGLTLTGFGIRITYVNCIQVSVG